jgi:hypothetical protein
VSHLAWCGSKEKKKTHRLIAIGWQLKVLATMFWVGGGLIDGFGRTLESGKKGADGSFGDPAVSFRVEGRSSMHRRGYITNEPKNPATTTEGGIIFSLHVFFFA